MTPPPTPPPVDNFLRIYTDLATLPNDQIIELDEFAGLGPKTTIKELTKMWVQLHLGIEWTIVTIDPLGFTSSLTARSRDKMETQHLRNHTTWHPANTLEFVRAIRNTTGTLLIVEGSEQSVPEWFKEFDRTVVVKRPPSATLGPATG